jgi:hypothetical protein
MIRGVFPGNSMIEMGDMVLCTGYPVVMVVVVVIVVTTKEANATMPL